MEGDVGPRDFIGTRHAEGIPVPGKSSGVGFEEVYEDGNEDSKIKATHFPIYIAVVVEGSMGQWCSLSWIFTINIPQILKIDNIWSFFLKQTYKVKTRIFLLIRSLPEPVGILLLMFVG